MTIVLEHEGLRVRTADEHDVSAIRALFVSAYGESYPYRSFFDEAWLLRSVLGDDVVVLVAEDVASGDVLGTASVVLDVGAQSDLVGELGRLAVAARARSRGVGLRLMEARLRIVEDRLHLAFVENRTAHPYSQRISVRSGLMPVGFLPRKHLLLERESVCLHARHFGPALGLRKNHPRVVPEVHRLASAALRSLGMPNDLVVDEESPAYAARGEFVAESMSSEGMPALLRIERGRVHRREVFGPMRLHYGLFKLAARKASYVLARDPSESGGAVAGGIGWLHDPVEQAARIFEVVARSDEATRFLLEQAVARCAELGTHYLEIDVSAHAPRMQRTLVELGFVAAAYLPAMVFTDVERLDVLRMVKLFGEHELETPELVEEARPFFEIVAEALRGTRIPAALDSAFDALPLFAGLDDAQCRALASAMRVRRVEPGEALFVAGNAAEALHVVLSGEVGIEREGRVLGEVVRGDVVGERGLLEGGRHGSTARARTQLEVATLDSSALERLVRLRPDVALVLYRNLARGLGRKLDSANG